MMSVHASFKNYFFVCHSPIGVMVARLALKSQVPWGPVPWVAVLKAEVLLVGLNPSPVREKLEAGVFSP